MHHPPPCPALERALADLRPIRTRRPARVLGAVAGISIAYAAAITWKMGVRRDLTTLPLIQFVLYGAACLATFLALLWCALMPPRGQVLSSGTIAARVTAPMLSALVALDVAIAIHPLAGPPAAAASLAQAIDTAARCLSTSLIIGAVPVALGLWSLRHLLPVGGWRVLAALGGAAGALAGLVLDVHCAVSDRAHVGLAHAAALLLPAAILALASRAPPARRLSSSPDRDMSDG